MPITLKFGTRCFDPLRKEEVSAGAHAPFQVSKFSCAHNRGGPPSRPFDLCTHRSSYRGPPPKRSPIFGQLSSRCYISYLNLPPAQVDSSSTIFDQPLVKVTRRLTVGRKIPTRIQEFKISNILPCRYFTHEKPPSINSISDAVDRWWL